MTLPPDTIDVLKQTSRTFFIPISLLPGGLQEAVGSAYLCMRAVDEIEDHPVLAAEPKVRLLRGVSALFQEQTNVTTFAHEQFAALFAQSPVALPRVTLGLSRWACQAPEPIAPRIWDAAAAMADRMAHWVEVDWNIRTEADLDHYTFSVAGAVGLLVCDIGGWMDGHQLHRVHALQFGRGLQAVNILRNRAADIARGVDFYPSGWTDAQMHVYARNNLERASAYAQSLPRAPFSYFIQVPLALAIATLDALERGEEKLSREAVRTVLRELEIVPNVS
jgi:farnesyl-diphosphate farnesyltransferase